MTDVSNRDLLAVLRAQLSLLVVVVVVMMSVTFKWALTLIRKSKKGTI